MSPDPATAVILIGNDIFFKPASDAISATITSREELSTCLDSKNVEPASIESFHLIMRSQSVDTLFDPDAIQSLVPLFSPDAQVCVHIMSSPGEEHIETVKMALVLANLRIEGIHDGGNDTQIVLAKLAQL